MSDVQFAVGWDYGAVKIIPAHSYIYTDAVKNLTQENIFPTIVCANKYDLPLLVIICCDFIVKGLTSGNCLNILDNAVLHADVAPSVLEKCLSLIDGSVDTVWQSEQFCAIGHKALCMILQRDTLAASEDTICSSVGRKDVHARWAAKMCTRQNMDASSANRREVLGQALFLIRFSLLTDVQLLIGPLKIRASHPCIINKADTPLL
ncbi:BTB/POZ domain-containing protein 1-like [Paramacrobiotus metropolitanus]|uniref:BTB/POZ domain-containing protein 1-like n=1 Tax=Paramacrobiotus metropolitanus TaxID=2943436 RepID=UPI0024463D88|nr:BTB/POZ domain-containing protein 1-like [Paramacrobiotus metropolitanus]